MMNQRKKLVVAAALVGALAFVVVHRVNDAREHAGEWTDGHAFSKSDEPPDVRRAVWEEPRAIDGELNTTSDETRAAVSSDGRFVVFGVGSRGLDADLWIADLVGSTPRHARPLTAVNTAHDEVAPAFGRDALYFASDRPGGAGGLDVWRVPFADGECGTAERLVGAVNSTADDTDPAPSLVRDELLFASNRGGDFDLYAATPVDSGFDVARLDELCSKDDEREPSVASDGRTACFASKRPGTRGFDLFRAQRTARGWTDVESVSALNGPLDERAPLLLSNGFEVWFARRGATGSLDLHRSRAVELVRVPPRGWSTAEILSIASLLALALLALLAERWPGLDTIYKCFLVSVLVHLFLLWWLHSVRIENGGAPSEKKRDRIRVHVRDDGSGLAAARSERAGNLAPMASHPSGSAAPQRIESAPSALAESAPAAARVEELKSADIADASLPSRAVGTSPPVLASALRETKVSDAEPRAARAPSVARDLALRPTDVGVVAQAQAAPTRMTSTAGEAAVSPLDAASDAPRSASAFDLQAPTTIETPMPPREDFAARIAPTRAESVPSLVDGETPRARRPADPAVDARARDEALLSGLLPSATAKSADSSAPDRARFEAELDESKSSRISTPIEAAALLDSTSKEPPPPVIERPAWEGTPYVNRVGAAKEHALRDNGGTVETERAVERGLAYLARIQNAKGYFGPLGVVDDKYGRIAVGKTALCTLAFLGAGHTHVSGTKYSANVARALAFLIAMQDETSGHFGDSDAYGHGIATYALAEAFALTKDATLRASLEPAVQHILAKQSKKDDARFFGGWSYYYSDERTFDRWPRTSITAWQVMALESAHLAGIDVPDRAFVDAATFLDAAHDDENDWYRYNHDPARLGSNYPTLPASTPAALFALSITGRDITTREFEGARAFVVTRAPKSFAFTGEDDFVRDGQGNPYFWYYGTLAMFRTGGGAWATWNAAMKRVLLPAQTQDGSWKPIDVYARYARDDDRDRGYTTALCVLSLEVYYRYYLPLLKAR